MSTNGEQGKVVASITVSLDGYVTGPDDRPGQGLGVGGERLHYWVMGGPWAYETDHEPGAGMGEADREYYDLLLQGQSAGICGRGMYDSAGAWGGTNPFPGTLVVLTHRTEDQPVESTGFVMVDGFDARFDGLERRIDRLEGRMDRLEIRMDALDAKIDRFREELSARILEAASQFGARITDLELRLSERMGGIEARMSRLEMRMERNLQWTVGVNLALWSTILVAILARG